MLEHQDFQLIMKDELEKYGLTISKFYEITDNACFFVPVTNDRKRVTMSISRSIVFELTLCRFIKTVCEVNKINND